MAFDPKRTKQVDNPLVDCPFVIDLTMPFEFGKGDAFGLEPPVKTALLPRSAGCAADRIAFCAHASGTHTECGAHINQAMDFASIFQSFPPVTRCVVLRVKPEIFEDCGGDTYL